MPVSHDQLQQLVQQAPAGVAASQYAMPATIPAAPPVAPPPVAPIAQQALEGAYPSWATEYEKFKAQPIRPPTVLTPEENAQFMQDLRTGTLSPWFNGLVAREAKEYPGTDEEDVLRGALRPEADYDLRGAWKAKVKPAWYPPDQSYHLPDAGPDGKMLKQPSHKTAWMQYFMQAGYPEPGSLGLNTYEQALAYARSNPPPKRVGE